MNLGFIGEELGTIEIDDIDGKRVHHFYTCAHCSNSIIIDPTRTRDRVRCKECWRVICEKKPICRTACTPLNELWNDGFEAREKWVQLVPEIMAGEEKTKLILP